MGVSRSLQRRPWMLSLVQRNALSLRNSNFHSICKTVECTTFTSLNPYLKGLTLLKNRPFFNRQQSALHHNHAVHTTVEKIGIDWSTGQVNIKFNDGIHSIFDGIWLRDHCPCSSCLNNQTLQRQFPTYKIPIGIVPLDAKIINHGKSIQVTWPHIKEIDGKGFTHNKESNEKYKESIYDSNWLRKYSYNYYKPNIKVNEHNAHKNLIPSNKILWTESIDEKKWVSLRELDIPSVKFDDIINTEKGVKQFVENIENYGVGFVTDVPPTSEDTKRLGERICFIRETHFGRFWEVSANNKHGDTAYQTVGLGPHTDTTYFTDPVRIQLFHIIKHDGEGGLSTYVDGFKVANQLKQQIPKAFEILCNTKLSAHCSGDDDIFIEPKEPFTMITLDPNTEQIQQIKYNNDDRSVLQFYSDEHNLSTSGTVKDFYWALQHWARLVQENIITIKNQPGLAIALDNWRFMHGRTEFTGSRLLVGSYHNNDDFVSRLKTLQNNQNLDDSSTKTKANLLTLNSRRNISVI